MSMINEEIDTASDQMMGTITREVEAAWMEWFGTDDEEGPGVDYNELMTLVENVVRIALDAAAEYPGEEQRRVVLAVAKLGRESKAGVPLRGFSQLLTEMETDILWLKP